MEINKFVKVKKLNRIEFEIVFPKPVKTIKNKTNNFDFNNIIELMCFPFIWIVFIDFTKENFIKYFQKPKRKTQLN